MVRTVPDRRAQGLFTVYRQGTIAPVVAGDYRVRLGRERLRDVTKDSQGLAGPNG